MLVFSQIRNVTSLTNDKARRRKKNSCFNDPINSIFESVLLLSNSQMNIIKCECCKEYSIFHIGLQK